MPTRGGGAHSAWMDSRGIVWYSFYGEASMIGSFNTATKEIKEHETTKGWSGYGLIVDRRDRVWAVGMSQRYTLMYDPKTERWRQYPTTSASRRVAEDSKGLIWTAEQFANRIASIDPNTNKVTEYELPLRYGNPYEVFPDGEDNLWIENNFYYSLVKFDQRTKKFTYFPFPGVGGHTPKLDRDAQGTLWFTNANSDPQGSTGPVIVALKPKGNVPSKASTAGN